jgi:hypothetical protein
MLYACSLYLNCRHTRVFPPHFSTDALSPCRCSVTAALAAAGRIDPSSVTRSHSCAVVAGGAVSLALCVSSAAAAVEASGRRRDAESAGAGDDDAAALCKSAVAFTSYRASLVPFSPPWWRAPHHSTSAVIDMSPWLLPQPDSAIAPQAPAAASSCSSSVSLACAGFAAVLRGTTAFAPHGVDLSPSAQRQSAVGGGVGDLSSAVPAYSEDSSHLSGQSHDLIPCALHRIEAILQRSQCSRALLMLLTKAWAWASLRAALSQFSLPLAGSSRALQCITAVFPVPLSSMFSVPPAAPLSSRLRGVAERLLECSSPSPFHPATALCLALTSDIVIGMSCTPHPQIASLFCNTLTR